MMTYRSPFRKCTLVDLLYTFHNKSSTIKENNNNNTIKVHVLLKATPPHHGHESGELEGGAL